MFNPRELEGEVDYSFFDSDCDESHVSRDGRKKIDRSSMTEQESPPAHERLHTGTTGGLSPRTDRTKKNLKQEVRSRASSGSSVASSSHKVINNDSDSEEDSNLHSKKSSGTFMSLLAKASVVDNEDVYHQSPNETEEEALSSKPKCSNSKWRNKRSPKKLIRRQHPRSPSPTSSEVSTDTDSGRSCSSLEPPILPRPNKPSLSSGVRRAKVGSVGSRDFPPLRTEESEDTVTDVSPLSSPDISPLQSLDLNHTEVEEGSLKDQQQQSVPSSGLSNIHQDEDSDPDVDDCSFSSESQLGDKLVYICPGGRNRKNYSFTNDEVQRIDRENQRLLRELSRISPTSRLGSAAGKKSCTANNLPHIRLSHSALNRQREQQRIRRDNLAFLKRLESAKPSPGLKRSEQLADYSRQVGYLGAPPSPIYTSITKKERSTSRTTSAGKGPRPASAAHHSARAVSITTDSSSTPVPRSKQLDTARPTWR